MNGISEARATGPIKGEGAVRETIPRFPPAFGVQRKEMFENPDQLPAPVNVLKLKN